MHFAFAYGYKDLGKYLLSLGADDTVANVHGMTCYEGLDPDEPPGLSEHAGDAGAGSIGGVEAAGGRDAAGSRRGRGRRFRDGVVSRRDDHAPASGGPAAWRDSRGTASRSPRGGSGRGDGSFFAEGWGDGRDPSTTSGPSTGLRIRTLPATAPDTAPETYPATHPVHTAPVTPATRPIPTPPGAVAPRRPIPSYPPTMTPGFHAGYGAMDPMGAAAFAAQQQMAAAAAMAAAQMQARR